MSGDFRLTRIYTYQNYAELRDVISECFIDIKTYKEAKFVSIWLEGILCRYTFNCPYAAVLREKVNRLHILSIRLP